MEEWTIRAGVLPIIGITIPNSQNTLMIQKMRSEMIQASDNLIWIFAPIQAKWKAACRICKSLSYSLYEAMHGMLPPLRTSVISSYIISF